MSVTQYFKPKSRHLVDPELIPLLERMPDFALSPSSLAPLRAKMAEMAASAPPISDGRAVKVENQIIAGAEGDLRLVVVTPQVVAAALPAILHCHGGGYVMSSPEATLPLLRRISEELGVVIVSPAYRLSPEAPFPAALDDIYAALVWMTQQADLIDAHNIGVMGESAGGGLAAALCLLARDRKGPALAYQNLLYPMLDDRSSEVSDNPVTGEFVWTRSSNAFCWSSYLGPMAAADEVSIYAAPARADDLSRLPPAAITTGSLDLFVDEDTDYARRLIRAGVATEYSIYPGCFHAFNLSPTAEVSQRSVTERIAALRRAIDRAGHSGA